MSPQRDRTLKMILFAAGAGATSLVPQTLRAQDCPVVAQIVNPAVCASGYGLFQMCPGQQPRLISCRRPEESPRTNSPAEMPTPRSPPER